MHSENNFPSKFDTKFAEFIKTQWENGNLDGYPDDHFIILALKNKLKDFEYKDTLIRNNVFSYYSPISNGDIDYEKFACNFIMNFSPKLNALSSIFKSDKFDNFIKYQLAANNNGKFDVDQFLEALSEVEVLAHWAGKTTWKEIIYECPAGTNNNHNPEARFVIDNPNFVEEETQFNIEVKTPKFINRDDSKYKILPAEALTKEGIDYIKKICADNGCSLILPRIEKLIDLINNAIEKFNDFNKRIVNILYINWTYSDIEVGNFLEAWSILVNNENGILLHPEISCKIKELCNDIYKKVSAIVVYSSSLDQMMFIDFTHVFTKTPPFINHHFRMAVLDKDNKELIERITQMNEDLSTHPIVFPITNLPMDEYEDMNYAMIVDLLKHNIINYCLKEE